MTKYHKEEARRRYFIEQFRCSCDNSATQIAHRISQSKEFIKKYGDDVIHHNYNLVPACSLECNGKVNISNKPMRINRLVKLIENHGEEKLGVAIIDDIISGEFV